jgi:uncharacterized membrane protein YjdF
MTNATIPQVAIATIALQVAAEEAYRVELEETEMVIHTIGKHKEYADKDDWLASKMDEWLDEAARRAA